MALAVSACGQGLSSHGNIKPPGGSARKVSSAAPPTVVCGKALNDTAAGAVLYDIAGRDSGVVVDDPSVHGEVFIQVSNSCVMGSELAINPAAAVDVIQSVRASDGKIAAVVLRPLRSVVTEVVATRDGHKVGCLRLDITK